MSDTALESLPTLSLTDLIPELPKEYNYQAGIDAALQGKGYREIAIAMGCSKQTLRNLRLQYLTFQDVIARARAYGLDELFDDIRFIVEDNAAIDHKKLKVLFEAQKYYLACSDPRKYGDRMNLVIEERIDLKGSLDQARTRVLKQLPQAEPQADEGNRENPEALRPKHSE